MRRGKVIEDGDGVLKAKYMRRYKELLVTGSIKSIDDMTVTVQLYDGKPMSASVPQRVTCEVVEAQVPMKGIAATPHYKKVLLDNGLSVQVPAHVLAGDQVVINTLDNSYITSCMVSEGLGVIELSAFRLRAVLDLYNHHCLVLGYGRPGRLDIVSKENDVLIFLLYPKKDDIVFSIFSKVNVFLGFLKGSKELADSDI
ncbi:hypothetical protein RHSIM_Rhsim13G0232600 [Rhododendron simsii]|uniref:Elongation factor P C-terminal domain-containing protein n=1 Tax=Rhododendron simsii TaxID=118357 RepID=A0A834G0B3_RHOSS|nr:hypothetical protein RHSIM_Rhsim13G0232600 [Rhododendron simsii]